MPSAKDIIIKPIHRDDANRIVSALHYSGGVVRNSQVHLGVFLGDRCGGALQFGPSLDKSKLVGLVRNTKWNDFIELNRMALADWLPRNGESRALAVSLRILRKTYPHLRFVVTFADGAQCGDGTIYRAAGFLLTGISKSSLWRLPPDLAALNGGPVAHRMKLDDKGSRISREILRRLGGRTKNDADMIAMGAEKIPGFMLRYVAFLDAAARADLAVPVLPYSAIEGAGAGMYLGEKRTRAKHSVDAPGDQPGEGGSTPTRALQSLEK